MKRVSLELLTQVQKKKLNRIEWRARAELSETLSDPATRPIANSIHIHSGHQMTANDSEQWNQIKIHFNAAQSEWQSKAKQWNATESIWKWGSGCGGVGVGKDVLAFLLPSDSRKESAINSDRKSPWRLQVLRDVLVIKFWHRKCP